MKKLNIIIWVMIAFSQVFPQQIISLEYFYDKDPGYGLGKKIVFTKNQNVDLNISLDLSSLQNGFHTLYLRAKDSNGKWSVPFAKQFYVIGITSNLQISKIEYFFDKDPGYGNGYNLPIIPLQQVDKEYALDLSSLDLGTHILYVRAADNNGNWSLVLVRLFAVTSNANSRNVISSIQYYFVKDSVKSKLYTYSNFNNSSDVDLNFNLDLSQLQSNNSYQAKIFAVNQGRVVSLPYSTTVNVIQAPTSLSIISPSGGEEWYAGTIHNIKWSSSNINAVKIEFSSDNGASWNLVATNIQAPQDTLSWLVPDINSNNCLVRITSLPDSTYISESASTFKIIKQVDSPGWKYTITGTNHIILVPLSVNPSINDTAIAKGDYIGVFFDSSGTLACGGYAVWDGTRNISVTAWGDDKSTSNVKEGFGDNEDFNWKIWQKKTNRTFSASATYTVNSQIPNGSTFVSNGISSLNTLKGYNSINAVNEEKIVPKDFSLSQNYPNPFNPATIINYSVPKPSFVTIKVYDIIGREIETLVKENKAPGNYEIIFKGNNYPSGIYFYRMQALSNSVGGFVQTKKFILLK